MANIKIIENQKCNMNFADSLLPNLLDQTQMHKIHGGNTGSGTIVTCGANYSLTSCRLRTDCGSKYSGGGTSCEKEYSTSESCWRA